MNCLALQKENNTLHLQLKEITVKNTIKVERAKKDLTQEDLAKRIGVSRQTINAVEKGRYVPSTLLALKMARIFETHVDSFFSLEEDE